MNVATTETTLIPSEEPPQPAPEDPLLRLAGVTHAERCGGDCRACRAHDIIKLEGVRVAKFHATSLQQRLTRQALGVEAPGSEHTVRLHQQEASLEAYKLRLAGCHAAINGTRNKLANMLGATKHVLKEKLDAEKALYIADAYEPVSHESVNPEPIQKALMTPLTDGESLNWMTRIRSLFGGSDQV